MDSTTTLHGISARLALSLTVVYALRVQLVFQVNVSIARLAILLSKTPLAIITARKTATKTHTTMQLEKLALNALQDSNTIELQKNAHIVLITALLARLRTMLLNAIHANLDMSYKAQPVQDVDKLAQHQHHSTTQQ